ncbi:MAG: hypothetical protein L3J16_00785 [Anaerolineales bacterium]|nr:hypothetical protein [Anaerolineales bacterium]
MTTKTDKETPLFEPFPKPNTMPDGWHMGELVPEPAPVAAKTAEDVEDASTD